MATKVNKYIDETIDNIRKDREVTKELLDDALKMNLGIEKLDLSCLNMLRHYKDQMNN